MIYALTLVGKQVLIPPFLALIVSLFTDFGQHVDVSLYSTVAQIAAVLALGVLVEMAVLMRSFIREEAKKAKNTEEAEDVMIVAGMFVFTMMAYFVITETAALYAVATSKSTTFLLLTALLSLSMLTWELATAHLARYDLEVQGSRRARGRGRRP